MKLVLAPRGCVHAPASSAASLVSAYTAGADAVCLQLQETRDGEIVVLDCADLSEIANFSGPVSEVPFQALRRLDIGFHFRDWRGTFVPYTAQVMSLRAVLRMLPADLQVLAIPFSGPLGNIQRLLASAARVFSNENRTPTFVVASEIEIQAMRGIEPSVPLAMLLESFASPLPVLAKYPLDAVIGRATDLFNGAAPTVLGTEIGKLFKAGKLPDGAVVIPEIGIPTPALMQAAAGAGFVQSVMTTSIAATPDIQRALSVFVNETFRGKPTDTETWAFGYARVGNFCHVYQDNGVHINIRPYTDNSLPATDDLERRLRRIENSLSLALKRTATYTGGGVGLVQGVLGRFIAEVDVTSWIAAQATMVEFAALNANPGRHQEPWNPDGTARTPRGDHESHSFFDPHGAPPFVGSEHDEDDGFRINSHFASEYADNNYGSAIGNGRQLAVSLRLERRGPYFAAYFKPQANMDERDWICSGVVRNDSLNDRVFLRCVGKRWRKADPDAPDQYLPVVANHFLISKWLVRQPR